MSWEHELARKIKGEKPGGTESGYLLGTVLSPRWTGTAYQGPLIISILGGMAMLTEELVDQLGQGERLVEGVTVALLPGERALRGGQRFLVAGVLGESGFYQNLRTLLSGEALEDGQRLYTTDEKTKLAGVEPGAQVNVIDTVKVNSSALPVTDKAVDVTVPTKVSDLTNDSGFQTAQDVQTAVSGSGYQANVIDTVKVNGSALPVTDKAVDVTVPTKVSDLTNDSGFQTAAQVQSAVGAAVSELLDFLAYHDLHYYPVITTEPQDVSIAAGQTAYFPVTAQGDGLSYQWYYRNPRSTGDEFRPSSNTTDTYSVKASSTTHSQGFFVYCVVTDRWGHTVTTRTASMTLA